MFDFLKFCDISDMKAKEVIIVVFVLVLWVGAIALFYHQWGKINGLDQTTTQLDYVHANMQVHFVDVPHIAFSQCSCAKTKKEDENQIFGFSWFRSFVLKPTCDERTNTFM